jgi:hypothetical protein
VISKKEDREPEPQRAAKPMIYTVSSGKDASGFRGTRMLLAGEIEGKEVKKPLHDQNSFQISQ